MTSLQRDRNFAFRVLQDCCQQHQIEQNMLNHSICRGIYLPWLKRLLIHQVHNGISVNARLLNNASSSTGKPSPVPIVILEDSPIPAHNKSVEVVVLQDTATSRKRAHVSIDGEKQQEIHLQGESRRIVKLLYTLKSPYVRRVVSIEERLTSTERKIAAYIFSISGNELAVMESLRQGLSVHSRVIDIWSNLLNMVENLRSRESVVRLFFITQVMTKKLLAETEGASTLIADFKFRMGLELSEHNVQHNLQGIDMRDLLADYLRKVGHAMADKVGGRTPMRLRMKWRTKVRHDNNGVFVMRHMETYKGQATNSWDCSLKTEGPEQDTLLDDLRKKYVTKIVLHDDNTVRDEVLKKAMEYNNLNTVENNPPLHVLMVRHDERVKRLLGEDH